MFHNAKLKTTHSHDDTAHIASYTDVEDYKRSNYISMNL